MKGAEAKATNKYSLNFKNKKLEEEYKKYMLNKVIFTNLYFTSFCFVFSILILIWVICLYFNVNDNLEKENLTVETINISQIQYLMKITRVYYEKYVLKYNISNENKYLYNGEDFSFLIRRYVYTREGFPMSIILSIIYLVILILLFKIKNQKLQNFLFSLNFLLTGFSFHILSGILRSFFYFSSDSILFIISLQLFIRFIVILISKIKWTHILIASLLSLTLEWIILINLHFKIPTSLIFYLGVNDLIHLFSIIIAYYSEYTFKINFFLLNRLKSEREYLINFFYKMDEGFFSYANNKIILMNNSMENIINIHQNQSKFNSSDLTANSAFLNLNSSENENDLIFSQEVNLNIKSNTTILIEQILKNLTEINVELNPEIYNYLYKDEKLELDKFYKLVHKMNNNGIDFNNFFVLGTINYDNLIINGIVNESYFYKFQVSFRLSDSEEDKYPYLEMLFTDISKITRDEREKTIDECRTIYLSKVAHEFKNPLSSLIELNENIIETKEKELIDSYAEHSKLICKTIYMFLNDFLLFANLKSICDPCIDINIIDCPNCNKHKLCKKCKNCNTCENSKKCLFDYSESIKNCIGMFMDMAKFENKNFKLIHIEDSDINMTRNCHRLTNRVFIDSEIFNSIIFNILYYSYKNTTVGEIKITSDQIQENNVVITLIETGPEIDSWFLKKVNNQRIQSLFEQNSDHTEKNEYASFNHFNKYLGLYIAKTLAVKIGSGLKIESTINGNRYSLVLPLAGIQGMIRQVNKNYHRFSTLHTRYKFSGNSLNTYCSKNESEADTVLLDKSFNFKIGYSYTGIIKTYNLNNLRDSSNESNLSVYERDISNEYEKCVKILIVDDEKLVRNTLKRYVSKLNSQTRIKYEVDEAENAFEALSLIYSNIIGRKFYNLLVIDECMPYIKGSSLIKFIIQLLHENKYQKLVIVSHTAFDAPELRNLIKESGADIIWDKPVSYETFKNFLSNL
jgi:CheY-like chemotaxis protein